MFVELHERLGPYVLLRELARGASAVVHLACDSRTGDAVAVKIASRDPQWSSEEARRFARLFANEASLAGKLVHPNIARMHAAVIDGDRDYIVMEYVEGSSLRRFCQPDTALPASQVVQLIFRCARAMDYVHGCGVLHRDLKPSNILLSTQGEVKIIDFGTAQIDWAARTQVGGFLGSPAYMAPEQLLDRASSRATDVYALGVVLYELLAGVHPFSGDGGPGIIHRILNAAPERLSDRVPGLAPELVALVERAMARDPAERYPDLFSLARDLMSCAH